MQKLRKALRQNLRLFYSLRTFILVIILTVMLLVTWTETFSAQPLEEGFSDKVADLSREAIIESSNPDESSLIKKKKKELEDLGIFNTQTGSLGNIIYSAIKLDGRILFQVAANAAIGEDSKDYFQLIQLRVQRIENTLAEIVARNLSPNKLQVVPAILNNQTVILISRTGTTQEWVLMTITELDASLYGLPISKLAEIRSRNVANALATAWKERQPEFLVRQSFISLGIVAAMILGSWILLYIRKYLSPEKYQQKSLLWNQKTLQVGHGIIWLPGIGLILELFPYTRGLGVWVLDNAITISIAIIAFLFVSKIFDIVVNLSEASEVFKNIPVRVFVQLFYILISVFFVVLIIADWFNQPLTNILAGFGAGSAILMLIFKDSIMGFTAGIQLAANRMVALGDWIEMPQYGANGDVVEVSLYTVKVQNWDKTITLIPTYALISNSFKNWRGMFESGGRRIKRVVYIDMNSIKFCNEEMLNRFAKVKYVSDYIQEKSQELINYNQKTGIIDNSVLVKEKWLTNVGIFRAYIVSYLKAHPKISSAHTFLVRHLQPTENGLPIEIYVFSSDTAWTHYENIQADIFDHILSVIPEFELRVFQTPSGYDLKEFRDHRLSDAGKLVEP